MAYTVTLFKPVYSKGGGLTSPTGRAYDMEPQSDMAVVTIDEAIESVEFYIDEAQEALGEEEGARKYFDQARRSVAVMGEDGGKVELPDGCTVEVEFWGAARAVNWMVANDHDPQTESFIDAYNQK